MTKVGLFFRVCLIAGGTIPFASFAASTASRPAADAVERYLSEGSAVVGFEWVDQPLNRVLLLRGEHALCALRFVSYRLADDARPATSFDSGDASRYAAYEAVELHTRGDEIRLGPITHGKLENRGLRGLGRLAFGVGETDIRCGRDKFSWIFPTGILLREGQNKVSIAPTNWMNFEEIRLNHPALQWFQRDPRLSRPFVILSSENLPR